MNKNTAIERLNSMIELKIKSLNKYVMNKLVTSIIKREIYDLQQIGEQIKEQNAIIQSLTERIIYLEDAKEMLEIIAVIHGIDTATILKYMNGYGIDGMRKLYDELFDENQIIIPLGIKPHTKK